MEHIHLIQGSPEWHAHRRNHYNASDAPAMMGCSPYETRAQLMRRLATGIAPDVPPAVQARFNDGHRFEALARPLAEAIIGEDLFPVVGANGRFSASFDGLTMDESTAFEHKTLNDTLRYTPWDEGNGEHLPLHYRVQMEHQLMVSDAERVLFMATRWEGDKCMEQRHCWYVSDAALRPQIIAGWQQLEADLATYTPPQAVPAIVAEPVQALPAVTVIVSGELMVRDNFAAFRTALDDFLAHRLIRKPQTDQDFADLDLQIKAMKGVESALEAAEAQMLAQVQTIDTAKKTKDMLHKLVRDNRLMAEKLLASEKERRKGEIVLQAQASLSDHLAALNRRLGKAYMPQTAASVDFAAVIKGLRSLESMQEAVITALTRAKLAASDTADRIQANLAHLAQHSDWRALFADEAALVLKAPDDFCAAVASRIAAHKAEIERRAEAERERIRAEEAARLEREAQASAREEQARLDAEKRASDEAAAQQIRAEASAKPAAVSNPVPLAAPSVVPMRRAEAAQEAATLNITAISQRLGFVVTADFLASGLGVHPAQSVKSARLYRPSDFDEICQRLIEHIEQVRAEQKEAA